MSSMSQATHPPVRQGQSPPLRNAFYFDASQNVCCKEHKAILTRKYSNTANNPNRWYYKCVGRCDIFLWEDKLPQLPAQATTTTDTNSLTQMTLRETFARVPPTPSSASKRRREADNTPATPAAKRVAFARDTPGSGLSPAERERRNKDIREAYDALARESGSGTSREVPQAALAVQTALAQAAEESSDSSDEYERSFPIAALIETLNNCDEIPALGNRPTTPTRPGSTTQIPTPPPTSPRGSKGKERERADRWPALQPDPENPFEDRPGPSNSQEIAAPTFTIALGDPLELCRSVGKIPPYVDSLAESNRALKKENKALRARIRELEKALNANKD